MSSCSQGIRPPARMRFIMKSGIGAKGKVSPLPERVISPPSREITTLSPSAMAAAASGASMTGSPILKALR